MAADTKKEGRTIMKPRARGVAAVAALATIALAGCSQPDQPAATVEGVAIPSSQVRASAIAVGPFLKQETDPTSQAVRDAVLGEASTIIAQRNGIPLGDDVVDQGIQASPILQAMAESQSARYPVVDGTEQSAGRTAAESISRTNTVVEALGESAYLEQLRALDITLNPKFGVWAPSPPFVYESSLSYTAPADRLGG